MTTPIALSGSISEFVFSLLKSANALDACMHTVKSAGGKALVSWDAHPTGVEFPFDLFGTLCEYLYFLDNRQYSVVLEDGAIIQISYQLRRNKIVWHRLSYHPCPVAFVAAELDEEPLSDFIRSLDNKSLRDRLRTKSAIRFDYDLAQSSVGHPASHMTLNEACCRIPVRSSLSLKSFTNFVFSNFYPALWNTVPAIHAFPKEAATSTILEHELSQVHISWIG